MTLDGLVGGTRNLGGATLSSNLSILPAASGSSNWLLFGYSYNYSTPYIAPTFSFVPTTSSLDVANFSAVNIPYIIPVTGLNGSRAANYIAQERITLAAPIGVTDNVTHTDFYARTCNWLYNEMENFTQPTTCNDACPNIMINGPAEICNTGDYLIPGLPSYATVVWASSNDNIATVNNTGRATKVFNGNITLTAAINFNGGLNCNIPSSLTKTIKVGISPDDLNVRYSRNNQGFQNVIFNNYNNTVVYTQTGNFSVNAFTNLTGTNIYTWSIFTTGGYGYSNFNPQGASATFTLTGTNAPTIPLSVTLTNTLNGCSSTPNPANTTINITASSNKNELKANEEEVPLTSIKEIKLIDKMGNIKLTKRYADDLTKNDRINIAHLPNDIYTLIIFNGTDWEAHKIIKQ